MLLRDKHVVVTGAGSGIGAALAVRFAAEGARVFAADIDESKAKVVGELCGGQSYVCDVTEEPQVLELVASAEAHYGPIDLFCSNAGVCHGEPGHAASASNDVWQQCWELHVMSHVYAARAVLPAMIKRGNGYLLHMASAAGLLSQIGDAAYSATKHAAVGFAESLAITHADDGIAVSVICPQYVATPLLGFNTASQSDQAVAESAGLISTEQLAETVVQGVGKECFLILPHPQVSQYIQFKSADYDKWLANMSRLRANIVETTGTLDLRSMYKLI